MEGYWHSQELIVVGESGITYGWQNRFDSYRKSYPNADAMGQLSFEIIEMKQLSEDF